VGAIAANQRIMTDSIARNDAGKVSILYSWLSFRQRQRVHELHRTVALNKLALDMQRAKHYLMHRIAELSA